MTRALITTVPFGEVDPGSLGLLEEAGIEYVINPIGRRLTEAELVPLVPGFDVLIAGTEPLTERVMEAAQQLRLISRVGVGRIGRRVIRLLSAFGARILANDLAPVTLYETVRWVDKPTLYREADLVTLHVPLTRLTGPRETPSRFSAVSRSTS